MPCRLRAGLALCSRTEIARLETNFDASQLFAVFEQETQLRQHAAAVDHRLQQQDKAIIARVIRTNHRCDCDLLTRVTPNIRQSFERVNQAFGVFNPT